MAFEYNEEALSNASKNGHIQILEWFENSGFELKYNKNVKKNAEIHGYNHILKWLEKIELKKNYNKYIIIIITIWTLV